MAVSKSSLSGGEIIRSVLMASSEVVSRANKIYPVVEDSAQLPYITYRRTSLQHTPIKGQRGSDTVGIEVLCFTANYAAGIELAEAVRDALDGMDSEEANGVRIRSCYLTDSEEAWQDDAYVQQLVFEIKI